VSLTQGRRLHSHTAGALALMHLFLVFTAHEFVRYPKVWCNLSRLSWPLQSGLNGPHSMLDIVYHVVQNLSTRWFLDYPLGVEALRAFLYGPWQPERPELVPRSETPMHARHSEDYIYFRRGADSPPVQNFAALTKSSVYVS
jgi:hypothetical protein